MDLYLITFISSRPVWNKSHREPNIIPSESDDLRAEAEAAVLRPVPSCADYNPHFCQLIHVGFKNGAEMRCLSLDALKVKEKIIARNATNNFYERHILPLFS